ncbi:MAG: hypothetical protein WBI14_09930 [Anaerolineaceae bacterium]
MLNKIVKNIKFLALIILLICACDRTVYQPPTSTAVLPNPLTNIIRTPALIDSYSPSGSVIPTSTSLPYTIDNPVTSPEEIKELLQVIKERYFQGFSEPGWYSNSDYYRGNQYWIHIKDASTLEIDSAFELLSLINYNNPLGNVVIRALILPDGRNAYFMVNEEKTETHVSSINNSAVNQNQSLKVEPFSNIFNLDSMLLSSYIDKVILPYVLNDTGIPNLFIKPKAWISIENNQEILNIELLETGNLPLTGESSSVRYTEIVSTFQFDWNSGAMISHLEIGKTEDGNMIESSWGPIQVDRYRVYFFENLPTDVNVLFENALRKLDEAYAAMDVN